MQVVMIGLGRMGVLQARFARHFGDVILAGVDVSASARSFFDETFGVPTFDSVESAGKRLAEADLVWVTVTDGQIEAVAQRLNGLIREDAVVVHTSGAASSRLLADHLVQPTASIHPLAACPPVTTSDEACVEAYDGVYHAIEGAPAAVELARRLVERIHGQIAAIDVDKKSLYHAAAVFASNYPVTLIDFAQRMFVDCGFDPVAARDASCRLLASALAGLRDRSPLDALTGPVKRRDQGTIKKHRDAINTFDAQTLAVYDAMLVATQNMVDRKDEG